jgi:hypothetical protein
MSGAHFDQQRQLYGATRDSRGAARLKRASGRKLSQVRDAAFDRSQWNRAIGCEGWNGTQKSLRVRMRGRAKDIGLRTKFYQVSSVHDGNAIGDVRNHGKVVRDEEHREPELAAKLVEQIENLLLDGDVECSGRLVRDQQLRAIHNGHGDHDALPHASRELVGIAAGALLRIGDGNFAHALNCATHRICFRDPMMREDGLGDLIAHAHDWIQSGHRLLKDHRNTRAAKLTKLIVGKTCERARGTVSILKGDGTLNHGRGRKQAHDGKRSDGLSGTGFADQSQYFSRSDRERESAHSGYGRGDRRVVFGTRRSSSARPWELNGEIADV